jgi:Protein of unknown function (DUF2742)
VTTQENRPGGNRAALTSTTLTAQCSVPLLGSVSAIRDWYEQNHGPLPRPPRLQTNPLESRQVHWPSVSDVVRPVLSRHPDYPMVGTPAWCALPTDDTRVIAAIFAAAEQWALQQWITQDAAAEGSRAISGALDWSVVR